MALSAGTKLGPYEILAPIGAGGMGEVYHARDTRLRRDVAIKVLPEAVAHDPDRLARFEREAQLLASLDHPNIGAIYGVEESGGARALILALIDGPTLAARIASGHPGPIPLDEAIPIARQIAEALEYAHERGVIHRDLKPANVKITSQGAVKVLDFGLAKALAAESEISMASPADGSSGSPTVSMHATQAGVILGTMAYMSPEQAKGTPVDRRADIWAFGCVLYEMLTGKPAFQGETTSDVLAAVMVKEPDWSDLPAGTPANIQRLLRRCLTKNIRQRLQAIGEARITLEEALSGDSGASLVTLPAQVSAPPPWRRILPWALAATLAIALGAVLMLLPARLRRPLVSVIRFTLPAPAWHVESEPASAVAISPDGTRIAYVSLSDSRLTGTNGSLVVAQPTQLVVKRLAGAAPTSIPGSAGAEAPFFSPDGRWIGFFQDGMLKKVSADGGPVLVLCEVTRNVGASWAENGFIYFAANGVGEILRVAEGGGTPQAVVRASSGERVAGFRWPQVLPGGTTVLFTTFGVDFLARQYRIEAYSFNTGQRRVLVDQGANARYLAPGYLVFTRDKVLMAAPFDAKDVRITGPAIPVVDGITADDWNGAADFAVSSTGALLYLTGGVEKAYRLVQVDRHGAGEPLGKWQRGFEDLSISPDGKHLAATIVENAGADVWIYDMGRDVLARLTDSGNCSDPLWPPSGNHVVYSCSSPEARLFTAASDGSSPAEPLLTAPAAEADSFSPNGRRLLYSTFSLARNDAALWILPLEGDRQPISIFPSSARVPDARFSPDGHWIAYVSTQAGRIQVYVQSYPAPGERMQVSTDGGEEPIWAPDGSELYFRNDAKVMGVDVKFKPALDVGKPHELFEGTYRLSHHGYGIQPDGRHFIMIQPVGGAQSRGELQVVLNWSDELKQRLAALRSDGR
ncbi:MAG TPA: protein kinase [Bryobacteraceae bacterium]|nr:protein kinase [Bryobacteraceae bacterium]